MGQTEPYIHDPYDPDSWITPAEAQKICNEKCSELLGEPAEFDMFGTSNWCITEKEAISVYRRDFGCRKGLKVIK